MRVAIIIIIISVGFVFAVSLNSVSIFRGSHYVVDVSGDSNDIDCSGCHSKIAEELYSNPNAPHYDLSCEACHRYNGSVVEQFALVNGSGVFPGKEAHAAYVPRCLDCHGEGVWVSSDGGLSYAPPARAFNLTPIPNFTAHKQLFEYCENLGDENLACLACHSNYSIEITFNYHNDIYFSSSDWNINSLTIEGSKTYAVNFTKSSKFSGKHTFIPLDDINCSRCHENIYLGLLNGTYTKHSPIYWASRWGSTNLWGHSRFHGLTEYNSSIDESQINNSYCYECHNYEKWNSSADYPGKGLYHCAEKVSCLTCHGHGQFKDPYYVIPGNQSTSPEGHENVMNQTANYARFVHGDACMACHDASKHSGRCKRGCHAGNQETTVYSEP